MVGSSETQGYWVEDKLRVHELFLYKLKKVL